MGHSHLPSGTSCGRGGMADAPDLGSGAYGVRVRVSSPARFPWHPICGSSSVGRAPPCQGGGRESEPRLPLHFLRGCSSMAELQPSKLATRVRFPSPAPSAIKRCIAAICGSSSVGRAPPCQGGGRESEPRLPLHMKKHLHFASAFFNDIPSAGGSEIAAAEEKISAVPEMGRLRFWQGVLIRLPERRASECQR